MRIVESKRGYFEGTHKGATIRIEKDTDGMRSPFYIIVTAADGSHMYDGWAPEGVETMKQAKREALRGSCLDKAS